MFTVGLAAGCAMISGPKRDANGFVAIFDGKTLDAWETPEPGYWTIEDGAITGTITEAQPCTVNQYLVWRGGELGDFELKMMRRFTGSPGINGGYQFRSLLLADHDVAGYQVDDNHGTPWLVRLYDEHGRHDLAFRGESTRMGLGPIEPKRDITPIPGVAGQPPHFKLEEWHEHHLIARGYHVELRIDGIKVAEFFDDDPTTRDATGILALQLHSGPPMKTQFKDIRIKRLD